MLGTVTKREKKLSVYVTNLSNSLVKSVNKKFSDTKDGYILSALSDSFNSVLGTETVEDDIEIAADYQLE